jgi:hypothetical protein
LPAIPVVSKNPWRALLSIAGLFAILLFLFWGYMRSGTTPPLGSRVPAAPALSFAPSSQKLFSGSLEIGARQIRWVNFTVPQNGRDAQINGAFRAFGGQGNDIVVIVTNDLEFENWKNGNVARLLYNSGKVTNGVVAVQGLAPGQYVLAFENRFSALSRKQVTGDITLTCSVP